ncbi:hypothetical protein VPNG_07524 [Cytospora leucostoma]|uniref:J domain-containing protein n=1 Tax=Cytospora leucostoma TaxID=1230097 RepID=A0A423WT21_9PEZI|nr:hypothetical protein VPNG_07524 [Cytospora leucostoma]
MSAERMPNYYEVLGISPDATGAEIRRAFFQLSLEKHPDKVGMSQEAHEEYVLITSAYEVLKDPSSREQYNDSLAEHQEQYDGEGWTHPYDRPNEEDDGLHPTPDEIAFLRYRSAMNGLRGLSISLDNLLLMISDLVRRLEENTLEELDVSMIQGLILSMRGWLDHITDGLEGLESLVNRINNLSDLEVQLQGLITRLMSQLYVPSTVSDAQAASDVETMLAAVQLWSMSI